MRRGRTPCSGILPRVLRLLGVMLVGLVTRGSGVEPTAWERSFWVHASLGLFTQRHYFGSDYPATAMPSAREVRNAAGMLGGACAANRLYLIYHRELPADQARSLFEVWKRAVPEGVELVPALVLRMYDPAQTPVFEPELLADLAGFFRERINPRRIAVYDIAANRDAAGALAILGRFFPEGVVRLGLQPGEPLESPFCSGVADTWSAMAHGRDNEKDWAQPGFGAGTLRDWVRARNSGSRPVAWNLVTVAWDYAATARGGYPGYDDAEKNMPLPAGRNRAALELVKTTASGERLAGFSSDLYILHENSRSPGHDGRQGAFYECLKRGEEYRGYFGRPFQEIAALFRGLRDAGGR